MNIYKESVLPNGLRIITSEDKNSDLATFAIFIKAGSRYEKADEFGYAHILEHMLLKGSKKYPSVLEISAARDRMGAMSNGSTNPERIYFFIQAAKNNLPKMFDILVDSVLYPLFDKKVLENEKAVIIQEINRSKDNFASMLWRTSNEKIFKGHSLGHDVLGSEESVTSTNRERLLNYYQKLFTSDRMAVVAIGGISHKVVLDFSKKFFNKLQRGRPISKFGIPKFHGGTFFQKAPSKQTFIVFKYAMPELTLKELTALGILSDYLGYGQSGLLKQELRHKSGLVYNVGSGIESYQDANIFYIDASTTRPEEAIAIIRQTIKNVEKTLNAKIVREMKEQATSVFLRMLANPTTELKILSGFWTLENRLVVPSEVIKLIKGVSREDIISAKRKYLKSENLLIATLGEKEVKIK